MSSPQRRASRPWLRCALPGLVLGLGGLGVGCAGSESTAEDAPPVTVTTPELTEQSLRGQWLQLAHPSLDRDGEVLSTPLGWFALSRRSFGTDGKAIGAMESYLYRSLDGVSWRLVSLPQGGVATDSYDDDLVLQDLAFAAGKLVLAGSWALNRHALLVSRNGETFQRVSLLEAGQTNPGLRSVRYAGDRWYALGSRDGYSSSDGTKWQRMSLGEAFLPNAVTYGRAQFLVAGNGGLALSPDAQTWERVQIDCGLATACIRDPSGGMHEVLNSAWFSDGWFYTNSLRSADGVNWEESDGPIPFARWGEYEVGSDLEGVVVWQPGVEPIRLELRAFPPDERGVPINPGFLGEDRIAPTLPPPPDTVSFPLDSGQDCTSSPCIVVNGRLYLAL